MCRASCMLQHCLAEELHPLFSACACFTLNMCIRFVGCRQRKQDRSFPLTLTRIWSRYAVCPYKLKQFHACIYPPRSHYSILNSGFTFTGNVLSTDCCGEDEQRKHAEDTDKNLQFVIYGNVLWPTCIICFILYLFADYQLSK